MAQDIHAYDPDFLLDYIGIPSDYLESNFDGYINQNENIFTEDGVGLQNLVATAARRELPTSMQSTRELVCGARQVS